MESLTQLLKKVSRNKLPEDQVETLKLFDNLTEEQINELITWGYIKSSEAGIVIRYLGYPKLSNYLAELLEFLQDGNWPAAGDVSRLLTSIGRPLIPYIINVFRNKNDALWNYWILVYIVKDWDNEIISAIRNELLELVNKADREGASIEALKILKRILSGKEFQQQYNYLLAQYEGEKYWLDDLKTILE